MKKKRFNEAQVLNVLKEYESGVSAIDLSRKYGVGESTIYAWQSKKRLSGTTLENQKMLQLELAKLRREKERLEMENAFLKKVAAGSSSRCIAL